MEEHKHVCHFRNVYTVDIKVESACQDYLFNERPRIKELIAKYNQRMKAKVQVKKNLHKGQHSQSATLQSIASKTSLASLATNKKNNNDNNNDKKTTSPRSVSNATTTTTTTTMTTSRSTRTTTTTTSTVTMTPTTATGHLEINASDAIQMEDSAFIEIVHDIDSDVEDNQNGMAFTEYIMQYTVLSNLGMLLKLFVVVFIDSYNLLLLLLYVCVLQLKHLMLHVVKYTNY